jgi:hypothetical protein
VPPVPGEKVGLAFRDSCGAATALTAINDPVEHLGCSGVRPL